MRTELRVCLHFVSRSSEEEKKKPELEKFGELSSFVSPQIAGALIKMNANLKAKT